MVHTEFGNEISGVPTFTATEFEQKRTKYCVLIPVLNEEHNIFAQFARMNPDLCDIIICDGGSADQSADLDMLSSHGVNALLVKTGPGKQGAQLRMGFWWALTRGYEGFITVDGNNKDSVEDLSQFIEKLDDGYDFVQGSRYMPGGKAINTPLIRHLSVKLIHVPLIRLSSGFPFTDTTNAFRGHSKNYITHADVQLFRDIFASYELLAYLSVRAKQLGLRVCEIPVCRAYPNTGKTPTKISLIRGNTGLLKILIKNLGRSYHP